MILPQSCLPLYLVLWENKEVISEDTLGHFRSAADNTAFKKKTTIRLCTLLKNCLGVK